MASRNVPNIPFPVPPKEYDQRYMAEVTRVFVQYMQQIQNPGEGRNTTVVLTSVPTSATGLESGTIYVDSSGFLKIAVATVVNVSGLAATGGVGQITKAP
ncbi:hypothetical protein UFOVP1064_43 [uncultured Caudovirales phage]|uniref:Uncharacterized protein n=1 Tax=uncultured Caudovirales phage TaxID=2100421 RepID=A0A6J5SBT6_9CAUD|nr:hypothetical protein UFOVP659_32 [uncultured Caudovirales phage]CAB4169316.1 hypothetical protein UFOVP885_11 [uncultured Caudovirales phage]CAB4181550.1 hypothetical protein UFOVP1064_43 [uncultured Caudovirales phage]CAB4189888.1 hypothetical protein UFOVP1197_20 [uncultured Caudovirales phage]CAB4196253.1 hypothetical protein UFOVP1294_70 [uncultured Caudovirales phage]